MSSYEIGTPNLSCNSSAAFAKGRLVLIEMSTLSGRTGTEGGAVGAGTTGGGSEFGVFPFGIWPAWALSSNKVGKAITRINDLRSMRSLLDFVTFHINGFLLGVRC